MHFPSLNDSERPTTACQIYDHPVVEKQKKADVAKHPTVFNHVGLLINGSLGTAELPFI